MRLLLKGDNMTEKDEAPKPPERPSEPPPRNIRDSGGGRDKK